MFEELDRDVDDAIDDLVHSVLRRFGLSVSSEDVRAMKRAGCDEAATITVKDDDGDKVKANYFPAHRDLRAFPTTVAAVKRNGDIDVYTYEECFVGVAISDSVGGYVAGSQFYAGYERLTKDDDEINTTFESGDQPIFDIADTPHPHQSSLEFCVTESEVGEACKLGGGLYTEKGGKLRYTQSYVAVL